MVAACRIFRETSARSGELGPSDPTSGASRLRIGVSDPAHDGVPLMLMGSARRVRRHEFNALVRNQLV